MVKQLYLLIICIISISTGLFAQDILTAEQYLAQVGEHYQSLEDYTAQIRITSGRQTMQAQTLYKAPSLMRLDFSNPEGQIIVFNGDVLTVYLPEYRAVLSQTVRTDSTAGGTVLASSTGLAILRRNYAASYKYSPTPVPLDEDSAAQDIEHSQDLVVKIVLTRRSLSEGFRELQLSIDPETFFIRRIEGLTIANESIRFEFNNIKENIGIADAQFTYESQPSANFYDNFLYRSSD
jgi:outer membrane lipoprotein-sorting protein